MITGTIYKLINSENELYYIGSTVQKLSKRMATHRSDVKNNKRPNNILHKKMVEIGIDKWNIQLLETIDNITKRELVRKEDEYINLNDENCLNIKKSSGVYLDEYKSKSEYEKARYLNCDKDKEQKRGKLKWERIKSDPIKYAEYRQKQLTRERNYRARHTK